MPYSDPPWHFSGQALYQLSLVRVEEARKYMPPELPLVSLFGWTLGGFYLARYSDSPAGRFDELVALAGLAWDFPTSAAWAARVYVNSREARNHGISAVGLPSRLASFRAAPLPSLGRKQQTIGQAQGQAQRREQPATWWDRHVAQRQRQRASTQAAQLPTISAGTGSSNSSSSRAAGACETLALELRNVEPSGGSWILQRLLGGGGRRPGRGLSGPVCTFEIPRLSPGFAPSIKMFLPSYSGGTPEHPGLLKYTLKLSARIRPVAPLRLSFPAERPAEERGSLEALDAVLGGRPLVCLSFEQMEMEVQAPQHWAPKGDAASKATGGQRLAQQLSPAPA